MIKQLLMGGAMLAASATAALASVNDRIDFYDADGKFVSVMAADIYSMTVEKADGATAADGYSTLVIKCHDNTERRYTIADTPRMLYLHPDETPHSITFSNSDHGRYALYNARNNPPMSDPDGPGVIDPTKPYDWRGAPCDFTVLFDVFPEKGYSCEYKITGDYTGKVYSDNPLFVFISEPSDNLLGVKSLAYFMPYEPVTMTLEATELNTYPDAEFLGTYSGYRIERPSSGRITRKPAKDFSMLFKSNGTYVLQTSDSENFNITDLFTYNGETNTFAYVPYDGDLKNPIDLEVKHGAVGSFTDGSGYMFAEVHYILEDRAENNRYYIGSTEDFEYTLASADDYGFRMLVQAVPADGSEPRYWFMDNYCSSRTDVTLDFISGSDIGETCSAYVRSDAEVICRYDIVDGTDPVFTMRGSESGTFSGESGSMGLDGFGTITLGTETGTYTVDGGILLAEIGGETRKFILDFNALTYTEQKSLVEWTGGTFFISDAVGAFEGGAENNLNSIRIAFDKNLMDKDYPGNASLSIQIRRTDGFGGGTLEAASTIGAYSYDADSRTITITNVYIGTSATSSERANVVLKVSDDGDSIWFDESVTDRIYSTDRSNSYVLTGKVNTLVRQ